MGTTLKIKRNIAISEAGLVFNPENGESFSLNPLGTEILSLIKDGISYEEIAKRITEHYHVERSTFDKDFHDFMDLLKQYELSERDEEKKG